MSYLWDSNEPTTDEEFDGSADDVDELQENQDFAHDDDFHNYIEDQLLDGMYEE